MYLVPLILFSRSAASSGMGVVYAKLAMLSSNKMLPDLESIMKRSEVK